MEDSSSDDNSNSHSSCDWERVRDIVNFEFEIL
jgi:hypothetical protein